MSDSDTADQVQAHATSGAASSVPASPRREAVALLILDAASGRVAASNPAGRRRLAGTTGARLADWLSDLATAAGHRDSTTVRTWTEADLTGPGAGRYLRVRALSTPIEFRSRECLLVVLRDDASAPTPLPPGVTDGVPAVDQGCAVFTLDAVGRIDSWGVTPQRLTGYRFEHVIGADTTLLHPAAARLAGDHHRALTHAYRTGDHRTEGWRLCNDGRLIWAEVTTAPLYDAVERLLGFAQVIHDLTPVRRLQHRRSAPTAAAQPPADGAHGLRPLPVPRVPVTPPAGAPVRGARRPAGRIPTQRHP